MLQGAVDAMGWHFGLDRAVALLFNEQDHQLEVKAEYYKEPLKPIGPRHYQLFTSSEWYQLLSEGKPLPLIEIQSNSGNGSNPNRKPDLALLISDTGSTSVVAFPLRHQGALLGCLTLHYVQEDRTFSEDLLEMGEAFADELATALRQASNLQDKIEDSRIFAGSSLPMVILERESFKIAQSNTAAAELLDGDENDLRGLPFLELFGESDAQRLKSAAGKLSPAHPVVNIYGMLAPSPSGQTVMLDGALSTVSAEEGGELILALYPAATANNNGAPPAVPATADAQSSARVEELAGSLSRQLTWERMARQIVSKLHATLDRDSVLQTAADALGRAMRASACLIVRTDSPAASIVTHEYADANLSPLGLGRSSQLPQGAIAYLRQRTVAITDLSSPNRPAGLSKEDVNSLLDNGVGALLSTPIAHHGLVYGAIVVESNDSREWTVQETEMIETIAQQVAIAVGNAQAYAQLKDQLFNMNLISNLTQQLTNALDQAGRNARAERPPEVVPMEPAATPLSSRELEVLKLIASGLANREIAQKLFLTESTVELHASRIRKKLKLKSRTALVKFACDNHLV